LYWLSRIQEDLIKYVNNHYSFIISSMSGRY
jgi:hypothetical protein